MESIRIILLFVCIVFFFPVKSFAEEGEYYVVTAPEYPTVAVKTNMMLLGLGVVNVGGECKLREQLSLDASFIYTPYTITRNWKLRVLALQPEVRYWFNSTFKGHFVGLHLHAAYFNVAVNDNYRYQDKGGNTPLFGVGASYGYSLKLPKGLALEFKLGAGYTHIKYDVFHNRSNGAWIRSDRKNYWGITNAGVSLVYVLN